MPGEVLLGDPRQAENQQQGSITAITFLFGFKESGEKELLKVIPKCKSHHLLALLSAIIPSLHTFTLSTPIMTTWVFKFSLVI